MPRKNISLLGLAAVLIVLAQPRAQGQRPPERDVRAAVDRAVAFLRPQLPKIQGGQQALVAMALLKNGLPADTPEIKASLDVIVARVRDGTYNPGANHVYEAGVSVMALANADAVRYKPQIEAIARYIMSVQNEKGDWDYPFNSGTGDTSISQYAILGLWEAVRAGIDVPARIWDKAAGWHVSRQLADGSFAYHPTGAQPAGFGNEGTHSMTAAGTASLHVCRMHLYPGATDAAESRGRKKTASSGKKYGVLIPITGDEEEAAESTETNDANYQTKTRLAAINKSISRGKQWLADRFTVVPQSSYGIYYLYGLERLAALAGFKQLDGHDWYAEAAAHLIATQKAGVWHDECGNEPSTAFGVLILTKATQKMLGAPKVRVEKRFGGGLLIGGRGLPEDLESVQLEQGALKVRKLKGPVDELLAELENAQSRKIESAQAALVETIATDDPEALIGQSQRLMRLARDKRSEVRRTVFWALGRTNDLRVVPTLIEGLKDADPDCLVEARNALKFISKKIDVDEPPDDPTSEQLAAAIALWKKWYLSVRPYDERDDLGDEPAK